MELSCAIEVRIGGRGEDRAAHFLFQGRHYFVVADGAGGVGGGALGADCVIKAAEKLARREYGSPAEALINADLELLGHGCLSTGVIVEIANGRIRGASCGDSVAWLIQKDSVTELTEEQERKPLLGAGGSPVAFKSTPFVGTLLVASDGLVNYAPRTSILSASLGENILNAANELAELPRMNSGNYPDDIAVLLARANV